MILIGDKTKDCRNRDSSNERIRLKENGIEDKKEEKHANLLACLHLPNQNQCHDLPLKRIQ